MGRIRLFRKRKGLFFRNDGSLPRQARERIRAGDFAPWSNELLSGPLGKDPEGPPGGAGGFRRSPSGKLLSEPGEE